MTDIAGRIALVTGGGSGIGRGLALALAAEGASVIVADIAQDRSSAVVDEITQAGGKAVAAVCDVSDRASVAEMKALAERTLGLPTLLFANAGVTAFDPVEKMSSDDIDWIIQVNLMGVFNCVEAFLPHMLEQKSGHVVATASMAGLIPPRIPYHAPYVAAKMGVIAMMLNMHTDYAKDNIGFTVLCPGGVVGRMAESPTVRPARFGGPSEAIGMQDHIIQANKIAFRPAEEVAQMVIEAIEKNRAMVLTDHTRRNLFHDLYVSTVTQAFDDAEAFQAKLESSPKEPAHAG